MKSTLYFFLSLFLFFGCKKDTPANPETPQAYYHPKGKLKQSISYNSISKDRIFSMAKYEYNSKSLKSKVISYFKDTSEIFSYWTFEYSDTLIKSETSYANQAGNINKSYTDNYIYSNSLLSKKEHYVYSKSKVMFEYLYEYLNGNLVNEKSVQLDPYFMWETKYSYDNNNHKIQTIYIDDTGNPTSIIKHTYANNLISIDSTFDGANVFKNLTTYKYDSQRRLTEKHLIIGSNQYLLESNTYNDLGISESLNYSYSDNWGYNFENCVTYEYY